MSLGESHSLPRIDKQLNVLQGSNIYRLQFVLKMKMRRNECFNTAKEFWRLIKSIFARRVNLLKNVITGVSLGTPENFHVSADFNQKSGLNQKRRAC